MGNTVKIIADLESQGGKYMSGRPIRVGITIEWVKKISLSWYFLFQHRISPKNIRISPDCADWKTSLSFFGMVPFELTTSFMFTWHILV